MEAALQIPQIHGLRHGKTLIDRAWTFAYGAFAAIGKTYGNQPYMVHNGSVVRIGMKFGVSDPEIVAALILHDVVEDTKVSRELLAALFGERVATLVWAVSQEEGVNRKERVKRTYPKIRMTPDATFVKLCDRIANVEKGVHEQNRHTEMYRKEQPSFREALYVQGQYEEMWAYLETLLK